MKNQKNNQNKFTFIDLFAGIGGFRLALEAFGGKCVFSSEWNKDSQKTYSLNFKETPSGDITKIKENEIPSHNVLCAGFPCQAFSISGKMLGFNDTRGTLFFDVARIVKFHKPEVLFLENVKNLVKHDGGKTIEVIKNTLDSLGYDVNLKVLKSSDFGIPQARERVYIVAFRKELKITDFSYPTPIQSHKIVKDILEKNEVVDPKCFINREDIVISKDEKNVKDPRKPLQIGKINKGGQGERIYSIYATGITLSAYGGGAASKTGAYYIDKKIRKLTPRECARLQGFPENYTLPQNRNIAYKQFGDSVSVPVLMEIFDKITKAYPNINSKIKKDIEKPYQLKLT